MVIACSLSKRQNRIVRVPRERLGPQPRAPAQRRPPPLRVRAEEAPGHLLAGEDELDVEVELVVGEEPRGGAQQFVAAAGRQESLALLPRQRSEAETHPGRLIPHLVPDHAAEAELLGWPRPVPPAPPPA